MFYIGSKDVKEHREGRIIPRTSATFHCVLGGRTYLPVYMSTWDVLGDQDSLMEMHLRK